MENSNCPKWPPEGFMDAKQSEMLPVPRGHVGEMRNWNKKEEKMVFHVLTLFPELIAGAFHTSITGRAAKRGQLCLHTVNIRDYADNKHQKVDDYPYGGGAGMVMQAEPVYQAYESVKKEQKKASRVIYVTPQGRVFDQKLALELSREEELVFLCGHYEGIDERVLEEIVTDYVSIGDYVLTGGELPALVMMDAVSRLVPGVLNNETSAEFESFHGNLLEYPQYSRPEVWHGNPVPGELLLGDHRKISAWRLERAQERTKKRRPDLFALYERRLHCEKELLRQKLLHTDMLESLRTDRGDLFTWEGENVTLLDALRGIAYVTAKDEEKGVQMLERLAERKNGDGRGSGRLRMVVLHQEFLAETARKYLGAFNICTCIQYVYTLKNPVSLRRRAEGVGVCRLDNSHRELLRLFAGDSLCDREEILEALKICEAQENPEAWEVLETGRIYGAFLEEALAGILKINMAGALDFLYVKRKWRQRGIGKALEAAWINECISQGRTPFLWVEEGRAAFLQLQESLGLYPAKGKLQILTF